MFLARKLDAREIYATLPAGFLERALLRGVRQVCGRRLNGLGSGRGVMASVSRREDAEEQCHVVSGAVYGGEIILAGGVTD